jgi:hypothetical protein
MLRPATSNVGASLATMRHLFIAATLVVFALVFTGLLAGALQVFQQRPGLAEDARYLESAMAHEPSGPLRG